MIYSCNQKTTPIGPAHPNHFHLSLAGLILSTCAFMVMVLALVLYVVNKRRRQNFRALDNEVVEESDNDPIISEFKYLYIKIVLVHFKIKKLKYYLDLKISLHLLTEPFLYLGNLATLSSPPPPNYDDIDEIDEIAAAAAASPPSPPLGESNKVLLTH